MRGCNRSPFGENPEGASMGGGGGGGVAVDDVKHSSQLSANVQDIVRFVALRRIKTVYKSGSTHARHI